MIEEICPREQIKQFCPIRETMSAHIIKDSCQMHRFELHFKRSQIKYLREVEHELTDPNLDVNFGTCTWEDGGERSREQTQGKKDGLESCRGPANTAGKTRMVTYYYFKDKAWRKNRNWNAMLIIWIQLLRIWTEAQGAHGIEATHAEPSCQKHEI